MQQNPTQPPLASNARQPSNYHWPSILLFAFSLFSILIFIFFAIILAIRGTLDLVQQADFFNSTSMFTIALESILVALTLGATSFFSLRRMLDKVEPEIHTRVNLWLFACLAIVWGLSLVTGNWITANLQLGWWAMPMLATISVGIPVIILGAFATRGINLGIRWRAWGIIGLGMSLGPFMIILAEIGIVAIVIIISTIFISSNPTMVDQVLQFASRLQSAPNEQIALRILEPLILHPLTIMSELTFVSILVPLVEELLKPVGLWFFANKIKTPAQGFALGALSGAAYALVESLGASAQFEIGWSMILVTRVGTGVVHILNSALMGWALVSAWQNRKYLLRLAGIYLIVVLLHGSWNAFALGFGLSQLTGSITGSSTYFQQIGLISSIGLASLTAIGLTTLLWINRHFRNSAVTSESTSEILKETV